MSKTPLNNSGPRSWSWFANIIRWLFRPSRSTPASTADPCRAAAFSTPTTSVHLVDSSLDFWLTTGRFAAEFERAFAHFWGLRHAVAGQLRLLRQFAGSDLPDLAQAGRTPACGPAMKSSPWPPAFPRPSTRSFKTGWCRCSSTCKMPTYNIDVDQLEAALSPKHPGDHDRAHARQSVRSGARHRLRRQAQPLADRRLLRRRRLRPIRASTVGTFGDLATCSFYPAHHITMGEGGCVLDRSPPAQNAGRIVPRLGPRLLVRSGQGQHLRQTLRLAAGPAPRRLRPQIHLLAHRLQPESHRHAGRRRRGPAQEAARFIEARAPQLPPISRRACGT